MVPEAYLKQQYRNKLLDALVPEGDTMNFARFEGKGLDEGQIIDLAETVPFFADHRVILLENTGLFKAKADRLADYTAALPDYLVLIFVEEEADKRSGCTRESRRPDWLRNSASRRRTT